MEPLRLKITNFYSYKEAEIDFTTFTKSLIIGTIDNDPDESNGSGKTALFECICWALFNKTRQKKLDDVVNFSEGEACVEFEFLFKNDIYKIVRKRSRKANESSVALYMNDGTEWHDQSASTPLETSKKIEGLIGTDYNVFVNSIYFKQNSISMFVDMGSGDRKSIIKKMMRMERWDTYQNSAKVKAKEANEKFEKNASTIETLANIETELEQNQRAIKLKTTELDKNQKAHDAILIELQKLIEKRNEMDIEVINEKKKSINVQIDGFKNEGRLNNKKYNDTRELIASLDNDLKLATKKMEALEVKISATHAGIFEIKKQPLDAKELDQDIINCKSEISSCKNRIADYSNPEFTIEEGECPICLNSITADDLPHIQAMKQDKLAKEKEKLIKHQLQLDKLQIEYSTRISNASRLEKLNADLVFLTNELNTARNEKLAKEDKSIHCKKQQEILFSYLTDIKNKIQERHQELERLDSLVLQQKDKSIESEITDKEEMRKLMVYKISNEQIALGSLLKERTLLEAKQKELADARLKAPELNKNKIACEQLVRFFGKHGIQSLLMDNVIEEIERHTNEILNLISNKPTSVFLKTQKKKSGESWQEDLEIDIITNGSTKTIESLSGGESFRVGLALRIALSETLARRNGGELKFLLLDEIDSQLDKKGKAKVFDYVINGLEKRFKILVITHDDVVKQRFSDIISVNKNNDYSTLVQIKQECAV